MLIYILATYILSGIGFATYAALTHMNEPGAYTLVDGLETVASWPYALWRSLNTKEPDAILPNGREISAPENPDEKPSA